MTLLLDLPHVGLDTNTLEDIRPSPYTAICILVSPYIS